MTVGTNCPRGGDAGHGGRTVIILDSANGSTEMHCTQHHGTVELVFRGDTECETLIERSGICIHNPPEDAGRAPDLQWRLATE
jgi:hypothetical protein